MVIVVVSSKIYGEASAIATLTRGGRGARLIMPYVPPIGSVVGVHFDELVIVAEVSGSGYRGTHREVDVAFLYVVADSPQPMHVQ